LKNIKKILQQTFKFFSYKLFVIIYGSIKGKISYKNNSKIEFQIIEKKNKVKYRVFKIKNCRLYTDRVHDTAVIIDNYIIDGPSHQLRPINNDIVENNIVYKKGTPKIKKKLNGKVLSLLTGGAGNNNYWHWLFDVLPRYGLCENATNINDLDFIIVPSLEKKFQKMTLGFLNIPEKKCLSSRLFRHVECSELFVTDHPNNIINDASKSMENIPVWISDWLKEKYGYLANKSNFKVNKHIYIDRSDSTASTKDLRLITNENEVKKFVDEMGFQSIKLANLDFMDQVKIFNQAEIIIGLHGAGFANLSFCKPGTKIVELKTEGEKVIENLAVNNKLIYKSVSSKPSAFDNKNQFGHIHISIDSLKKLL